jgi:hypothetical protein
MPTSAEIATSRSESTTLRRSDAQIGTSTAPGVPPYRSSTRSEIFS